MISRRAFLLSVGSLLTASFVDRVRLYVHETGQPLLLPQPKALQTLYVYELPEMDVLLDGTTDGTRWQVSLGPWVCEPPAPTWREYLMEQGCNLDTPEGLHRALHDHELQPEELDEAVRSWGDIWEHHESPLAKAYVLLKELEFDRPLRGRGKRAGRIDYVEWGGHPGSSERWVELRDRTSISLLQARILERGLPLELTIGD